MTIQQDGLLSRIQKKINESNNGSYINESHIFDMVHQFISLKVIKNARQKKILDDKTFKTAYEMGMKYSDKQASDTLEELKRSLMNYAIDVLSGETPVKARIISLYAKLAGYLHLEDGL